MKIVFVDILIIIIALLFKACNTTEPPPNGDKPTLELTLENVSCIEAWINLKTTNLQLPNSVVLKQISSTGDTTSQILNLNTQDSLLYVDTLLPNQNYQYQVSSNQYQVSSNMLSVTTMDTTNHDFTFQTFTFGEHSNSVLYDCAFISPENIWCVGEIYMNDSLGNPDPNLYNLIKWNGNDFKVERVYYNYQGSNFLAPLRSIFAFSEKDVWVGSNQPMHWTGIMWEKWDLSGDIWEGWINKIWGNSSSDLYIVGNNGNIAWYNGSQWTKIESGTDVDLLDIWGSPDGSIVWACGETIYKTVLIKIENNMAKVVFEGTYPMPQVKNRFSDGLLSLWTNYNNFIYVLSPYNLYRCKVTTSGEGQELYPYDDYFKGAYLRLRGTAPNNLFTSGNKSTITHFNGSSWKIYDELINEDQLLRGLDVNENLLVTVGEKFENTFYYKAIIIVGYK